MGAREMDQQRDPNRFETATNPEQRSFEGDLDDATNADRPSEADFGDTDLRAANSGGTAGGEGPPEESNAAPARNVAGLGDVDGDLGAGTPPNVDVHKLGQDDKPEQDWGEPADEGAMFSSNNTRRGVKTEAERGQGAKTRAANKDIFSRRN
ncbi:hypothetical protein LRS10_05180 [Phenylobacterium sp. J426]|uniref:hypothetical protein n=1 Tax=Phenylobacterium sp. J426 TaxID=2898439 RepID=UPI002151A487|nr:hypothetical protein [Phenylobacterium sp. J426]MCR5873621.1 hypothetical protein [Phenylobacterium sp. J426]